LTDSKKSDALYGVDCDVVGCKYHGHDNRCFADGISVEAASATTKKETFCGTFSPRPLS
jgi:hypothetical protein